MERAIKLPELLEKSSIFLFGPRGTGKSFLIRQQLNLSIVKIDLLDAATFLRLQRHPEELRDIVGRSPVVVIDEVQRIPEILNSVHQLIEESGIRFLLTGSSARKLRRGGANLLAGRALQAWMQPLTWQEIDADGEFNLDRFLLYGGLPNAYLNSQDFEYLFAYVDLYLREEIQAEALVKNLANYSRFLECAALASGEILNFSNVANDAQLSPSTVNDYYQILEDTLLGYRLEPWTKSKKRKAVQTSKFFLFDPGVVNAITQVTTLTRASNLYGRAFEHFIANEILAYLRYRRKRTKLSFWRAQQKPHYEVDFVIGDEVAIEVKATKQASDRDHNGLLALSEEKKWKHRLIVSQDPIKKRFESGIEHLPWEEFVKALWAGNYG